MKYPNIDTLEKFGLDNIPDLDTAVLATLELFEKNGLPSLEQPSFNLPLIVGSGNALPVGRILYHDKKAVFADESIYKETLKINPDIDGVVVVSASGKKSSDDVIKYLKENGIENRLITANRDWINREPYTYNVSTYLGMILSKTGENPSSIKKFIESEVDKNIPSNLDKFNSFFFIIPPSS